MLEVKPLRNKRKAAFRSRDWKAMKATKREPYSAATENAQALENIAVLKKNRLNDLTDLWPVAFTWHLMKTLKRFFLCLLRPQVEHHQNKLQFTYQQGVGVRESILRLLHRAQSHLNEGGHTQTLPVHSIPSSPPYFGTNWGWEWTPVSRIGSPTTSIAAHSRSGWRMPRLHCGQQHWSPEMCWLHSHCWLHFAAWCQTYQLQLDRFKTKEPVTKTGLLTFAAYGCGYFFQSMVASAQFQSVAHWGRGSYVSNKDRSLD